MTKTITIPNLTPGTTYVLQIRADRPTGSSDWSQVLQFTTTTDSQGPAKPSTPIVKTGFKNMVVGWNGRTAAGTLIDDDFKYMEVHAAPNATYTPSEDTLYTTMYDALAQEAVVDGLENGIEQWVKLVPVDVAGNKGAVSDSASATPKSITGIDIEELTIEVGNINFDAGDIGAPFAFYQTTAPTTRPVTAAKPVNPVQAGDVWYDTDDGYKMYTFNGGKWNAMKAEAEQTETGAKIYRQAAAPTGGIYEENDIWFDTANGNRVNLWSGSAWTVAPLGTGAIANTAITNDLLAANINAGKITAGTMLGERIQAGTMDASRITAGTITSDRIGANQVTAGKIRAGTITAGDGVIANAAIDYAQIGSVSASSISVSGTMTATMTVSGTIQTSSSYPYVYMNSGGIRAVNSSGSTTFRVDSSGGSGSFSGGVRATTFYSRGIDTNGYSFIEIGDAYRNEANNDEIRLVNGSNASSIRNPNSYPGRLRISVSSGGNDTIDFDGTRGVISPRFTLGSASATFPYLTSYNSGSSGYWGRMVFEGSNVYDGGSLDLYLGSRGNSHTWIANRYVGVKLLGSDLYQVQIRNSSDSNYANLQAARGDFNSLYVNGSAVSTSAPNLSDYVTTYGTFRGSSYGTHYGSVQSSGQLRGYDLAVTSNMATGYQNGSVVYSNNFLIHSSSEFKQNIVDIDLDVFDALGRASMKVWNWLEPDSTGDIGGSVGLLVDELPDWLTLKEKSYPQGAMNALLWESCKRLLDEVNKLKGKVESLST